MNKYTVRIRYAGSILVNVDAKDETEAQQKGQTTIEDMDSSAFLSALEPQHLDTEVIQLCSKCNCQLHQTEADPCNKCKANN